MKWLRWPLKAIVVTGAYYIMLKQTTDMQKQMREFTDRSKSEAYVPLEMTLNGKPTDVMSPNYWTRLTIADGRAYLDRGDGSRNTFLAIKTTDSLILSSIDGTRKPGVFKLRTDGKRVILDGTWQKSPAHFRLDRRDEMAFPLFSRGFHWINEVPYNR